MKKKTKPKSPKFIISKAADKEQNEFIRNSKNPSLILKESCDHLKLKVLKIHPELREWQWLKKRVGKWIKGNLNTRDEISEDLMMKTIPRLAQRKEWVYHLDAYLKEATRGFYNNYLKKKYRGKGIFENAEDMEVFRAKESRLDKESKLKIRLLPSISKRQIDIIILIGIDGYTHNEVAEELKVSTKTIQRELKQISKNPDVRRVLRENMREKETSKKKDGKYCQS